MSAAELQQELLARGQSIQGLTKLELQDLLWHAVQAEAGLLPPQDQGQGVQLLDSEYHTQSEYLAIKYCCIRYYNW